MTSKKQIFTYAKTRCTPGQSARVTAVLEAIGTAKVALYAALSRSLYPSSSRRAQVVLLREDLPVQKAKVFQLWRQPGSQDLLNVESGAHLAANKSSPYRSGYSCGLENHIEIEFGKRFSAAC